MKKAKKVKIFGVAAAVLLAVGLLCITVVIQSSKISSFEECRKSGWLIRAMVVYDYVAPMENDVEQECILWTGKKFGVNRVRYY